MDMARDEIAGLILGHRQNDLHVGARRAEIGTLQFNTAFRTKVFGIGETGDRNDRNGGDEPSEGGDH